MLNSVNILLVGVGGQGTILAAKILAHAALAAEYQIKMSEIHGMAQRGGSVVTQVRLGQQVYSPVIDPGEADIIVAFERLEGYRWAHYLKKGGVLIINTQQIEPLPVLIGAAAYPPNILEDLQSRVSRLIEVPALELAEAAGSQKATNMVLMGVLAQVMEMPAELWRQVLHSKIPEHLLKLNTKAFYLGSRYGESA